MRRRLEVALTKGESWKVKYIALVPKVKTMSLSFKKLYGSGDGWCDAISGPIECDKGFKVRFDLVGSSSWDEYTFAAVFLMDSKVPVDQCRNTLNSVYKIEDRRVQAYGVWTTDPSPYNLKTVFNNDSYGNRTSPVILEYDR